MTKLWETLSPPWHACLEQAWAAYRAGSLPIGVVIADKDGKLIAQGRNMGSFEDRSPHALARSAVGHAEVVALGKVKRPRTVANCVLYASTEPCAMCAGAIRVASVGELRYASHDTRFGGAGLLRVRAGKPPYAGRIFGPESELLDVLLSAMLIEREIAWKEALGGKRAPAKERPRATAFAAYLLRRGLLASLAKQGAPAEGMLNTLEREFARGAWKPAA